MLQENRALAELRLGWNRLFHKGAAEMGIGMRSSPSLTRLDVQSNGLGDRGAAYMANALLDNRGLTHLNLSRNGVAGAGCLVLAEAITSNRTLTSLLLHDNPLGAEGGNHLLIALAENPTIKHFGLQGASFVDVVGPDEPGGKPQAVRTPSALPPSSLFLCVQYLAARSGPWFRSGSYTNGTRAPGHKMQCR